MSIRRSLKILGSLGLSSFCWDCFGSWLNRFCGTYNVVVFLASCSQWTIKSIIFEQEEKESQRSIQTTIMKSYEFSHFIFTNCVTSQIWNFQAVPDPTGPKWHHSSTLLFTSFHAHFSLLKEQSQQTGCIIAWLEDHRSLHNFYTLFRIVSTGAMLSSKGVSLWFLASICCDFSLLSSRLSPQWIFFLDLQYWLIEIWVVSPYSALDLSLLFPNISISV